MWTRKEVKERGKKSFKKNYWKAIIVAILLSIVAGGSYNGFSSGSSAASQNVMRAYSDSDDGSMLIGETDNADSLVKDDKNAGNNIEAADDSDSFKIDVNGSDSKGFLAVMGITFFVVFATVTAIIVALDAFLVNPIEMGCNKFFLKNLDEDADISTITYAFDHGYKNVVKVLFRRDIAIMLWSMLFVIPGIVKSYEYRMLPYILADNPEMSWQDAFAESKELMTGNKWRAFVLDLSFIGWKLLSILTLGLLTIFYVNPYKFSTNAALYEALKYGTCEA